MKVHPSTRRDLHVLDLGNGTLNTFLREGSQLIAVSVETQPEFEVGRPYTSFRNCQVVSSMYDVAPDGRSFFVSKTTSAPKEVRRHRTFGDELPF